MSLPILKSQWHSIAFRTIATILSIDVHSSYYPGHRLALILYSAALKNPLQEAKPNNIQLLKTKKIHFISHAYFLSVCCAHLYSSPLHVGLPRWLSGKKKKRSTCQCRKCKRHEFNPWVRKIPWGRKWQPNPGFLPGKFHRQRSLVDYSPWGHKELDKTEWLSTYTHLHAVCIHTNGQCAFLLCLQHLSLSL